MSNKEDLTDNVEGAGSVEDAATAGLILYSQIFTKSTDEVEIKFCI